MENNFLSKMSEDVLNKQEVIQEGIGTNVGKFVSNQFAKVKTWAKKIYIKTMKTFGIGIAQVGTKFNLFDKSGNKLLGKDVKKITSSKDSRTIVVQDSNVKLQVSKDKPSFGVKWEGSAAVVRMFDFKPKAVSESVYGRMDNMLNEWNETSAEIENDLTMGDPDEDDYEEELSGLLDFTTSHVDYKGLEDVLDELIEGLHASTDENAVISIVGDSGIGKTEIVKALAQEKQMNFFYVELGKIDKSLIKGIPAITDELRLDPKNPEGPKKTHQQIDLLMAEKLFPQIKKMVGNGMDVEDNGSDKWIIFLDEFNRAETSVTSVIMNLFLDGMITAAIKSEIDEEGRLINTSESGAISLPTNSLYVLGMNESQEKMANTEIAGLMQETHNLDTATTSRIARSFILNATAEAWSDNYATLPRNTKYKESKIDDNGKKDPKTKIPISVVVYPQVPKILQLYIRELDGKNSEKGGVFNMVYANSADNFAKMDPRRWSAISSEFYRLAWIDWEKLSDERKYSKFNLKQASVLFKSMKSSRESMDARKTKTSNSSKRRMDKIITGLKKEANDVETQKRLAFSAWATARLPIAQKLLNKTLISSMFGVGYETDDGQSREENAEGFMRDMHSWLVKKANASIPSEKFVFGYSAMKNGSKDKDMIKLKNKIKKVYDVDVKSGKRDSTLLETTEIASKISSFFASIQLGSTNMFEITSEFKSKGKVIEKAVPGNYEFAKRLLGSGMVKGETFGLDEVHLDEKEFGKFSKTTSYGYSPAVTSIFKGVVESKQLSAKMEGVVKAALKMITENILAINKDFSDNSDDIRQAIIHDLQKTDNSKFDNEKDYGVIPEAEMNNIKKSILFTEPFSELVIMSLHGDEEFRAMGGTSGTREADAIKKTAAGNFKTKEEAKPKIADLPESSTFNKLFNQLLD